MSSISYQSPDVSQNVELKKGNIASFFKGAANAKAAKGSAHTSAARIKSVPHDSTSEQTAAAVKPEVTDGPHAGLNTSTANLASELATGIHGLQSKHDDSQVGTTGHGKQLQPHSGPQSAGLPTMPEVIDLAGNTVDKEEAAEGDVLNTDDAGGIGALLSLACKCLLCCKMKETVEASG